MGETTNNKILFWASFLTLIAAGIGFSVRGDILGDWGQQFGFTQSELGEITGRAWSGSASPSSSSASSPTASATAS